MRIVLFASLCLLLACSRKTAQSTALPQIVNHPTFESVGDPLLVFPVDSVPSATVEAIGSVVIYFGFDADKPLPDQEAALSILSQCAGKVVTLRGHTCPIGSDEYNIGLGYRRAMSLLPYLDGAKATAVYSVGENQLVTTEESQYHLNRRVEVEIK